MYAGASVVKTDMSSPSSAAYGPARPSGWKGCSTPRIDLPSHRSVARTRCRSVCANDHSPSTDVSTAALRQRGRPLEGGRPGALQRGPVRTQAVRVLGAALGAAGKAAVELGLDERDHVDAVDAQEAAVREPRRIDVRAVDVDLAHHDAGQVGVDEPGTPQADAAELRSPQVVGSGEGCHDFSSFGPGPMVSRTADIGPDRLGPIRCEVVPNRRVRVAERVRTMNKVSLT